MNCEICGRDNVTVTTRMVCDDCHTRGLSAAHHNLIRRVHKLLGDRGWDKTAAGWCHVRTGQCATMETALVQEIDNGWSASSETEVTR